MRKYSFIFVGILILLGINKVEGQISTEELPVSYSLDLNKRANLLDSMSIKILPHLDMAKIEKEDTENKGKERLFRFGDSHKVDYNLNNSGQWTVLSNGDKLWQLKIYCPEALSINLLYDKFWLPEGENFFIFNNNYKQIIGAFTSVNTEDGARQNKKVVKY